MTTVMETLAAIHPLGRIPFRLRIGVTGHRSLEDEDQYRVKVREIVRDLVARLGELTDMDIELTIVSPLAEGADRLVAEELMEMGALLEVPLPMPEEQYLDTFTPTPEAAFQRAKADFQRLIARAELVVRMPQATTTEDAFAQVGRYVVEHSDALLALWDEEPSRGLGGTEDVISYARSLQVPLVWISTVSKRTNEEIARELIARQTLQSMRAFNRAGIDASSFDEVRGAHERGVTEEARAVGLDPLRVQNYLTWISPYFVRADLLANRYQFRYMAGTVLLLAFATLSVALVALSALSGGSKPATAGLELGALVVFGLLAVAGRALHLHDRWLSSRFLAERFRSAIFLAIVGLSDRRGSSLEVFHSTAKGNAPEAWLRRAFSEVWQRRPRTAPDFDPIALRRFLGEYWLHGQAAYFGRRGRSYQAILALLKTLLVGLYAVTLLSLAVHASGLLEHEKLVFEASDILTFVAVISPALAAAISGFLVQREYVRNSERYLQMTDQLRHVLARISFADDGPALQGAVLDAEQVLMEEGGAWYSVMKFHDFELRR